jgi:hypothetical protein
MLTDSGDHYKQQTITQLEQIMGAEAAYPEEERLTLHMIGFGPYVDIQFVEKLADIGNGSFISCQTGGDMDRLDLVKAFSHLASHPAVKVSLMREIRGAPTRAAGSKAARCVLLRTTGKQPEAVLCTIEV